MHSRRDFLRGTISLSALAVVGPSMLMLEGCNDQNTIALLIEELSSSWAALETALGKSLPSSITNLFNDAVAAVKNWKPGTPVQGVVQVLQDLAAAVGDITNVIPGMNALEAAGASIILNFVINIIEDIDPAAVPPAANVSLNRLIVKAAHPNLSPRHILSGEVSGGQLRKQFRLQWPSITGHEVVDAK